MKCRLQFLHSDPLVFGVVFGLRHGGGECYIRVMSFMGLGQLSEPGFTGLKD
jgi:hypothetical protein